MSEEEQLVVEEVGSEAGVAPEVEAAPAEAEPAPSVADVEAEPAPIDDSPSVASGEGTPASFPSADDFSWDNWAGQHDELPEHVRSWSEKFNAYYMSESIKLKLLSGNRNTRSRVQNTKSCKKRISPTKRRSKRRSIRKQLNTLNGLKPSTKHCSRMRS